jgi:large subunit ribosomal protein L9
MMVILQDDVLHLGSIGDIVKVRDGYARNFLVPRGLALAADERNVRRLEHQKRIAAARANKLLSGAKEIAERVSATAVSIRREAGEEGKLFGAVTNRDIAEALVAEGFEISKRQVILEDTIRNLGVFNVPVKVHPKVEAIAKVYVIQS